MKFLPVSEADDALREGGEKLAPEPSAFPCVGTRRPAVMERTGRR